jgi:hypothetical protein
LHLTLRLAVVENDACNRPDPSHPTGKALCAKGRTWPEVVEAGDRLLFPNAPHAPQGRSRSRLAAHQLGGALDETASVLRRIAAESGSEAVAFAEATAAGTAISVAAP